MDDNQTHLLPLGVFLDDFQQARKFAAYILEKGLHDKPKTELRDLVHLAFNTSLIISYSRPFFDNQHYPGQDTSSLELHTHKILTKDELKLHKQIKYRRNKEYAHSDAYSHLFEGHDYNGRGLHLTKIAFEPLKKYEVNKLKVMIEKWIKHLKGYS